MDLRALPEMYGLNGVILALEGGLEEAVGEGTEADGTFPASVPSVREGAGSAFQGDRQRCSAALGQATCF